MQPMMQGQMQQQMQPGQPGQDQEESGEVTFQKDKSQVSLLLIPIRLRKA